MNIVSSHFRYKSPLDPDLQGLNDDQLNLLLAQVALEKRLKEIAEKEQEYKKWSKESERQAHGGGSMVSFGEDSLYTREDIEWMVEDPDLSDVGFSVGKPELE